MLRDSYFSVNAGYLDVPFTQRQLQPGVRAASIDNPHAAVRVLLFGHEFNRFVSAQASYMRPAAFINYHNVNGAPGTDHHHVRVNYGSVTLKARAPIRARLSVYGDGGFGLASRTGFAAGGAPAVTDGHYSTVLLGGGVEYDLNRRWSLTGGVSYLPGKSIIDQPRTLFSSGGFRYTMRPIPQERVEANREAGFIFPRQVIQLEYSTGIGYAINDFVSTTVPVFWGGDVRVDAGVAPHYERNVFHTRKLFALDTGASAGFYRTRNGQRFHTLSVYPLLRLLFVRTKTADLYVAYSLAGPTYISKVVLDGLDTGHHFTFQDFMGLGVFAGKNRNLNVGVKINHYSNGNIFTQNAGVMIPLTFSLGFAF